ncbi:hypothetical protein GINT2_001875 [Glugoides intestinalis]
MNGEGMIGLVKENHAKKPDSDKIKRGKIHSIDESIKISEDPFDMLNNKVFRPVSETKRVQKQVEIAKTTDDELLAGLIKVKSQFEKKAVEIKAGIFSKLKIISKSELALSPRKYYKFPFDISVVNDDSEIFQMMRDEFLTALGSCYSNYRKFLESFKVIFNEATFEFTQKGVRCPEGCSRLLRANEIDFKNEGEYLRIEAKEVCLIYDVLMNSEIPKGKCLPFIISEFEFENGIMFRTRIKKGPTVRNGERIEFSYVLTGPIDTTGLEIPSECVIEYD